MFVVVNKIAVPQAHQQAVTEGFEKAAPHMKMFKGFLGMELWTDENNVIWAVSRWESKEALAEYTNHPMFQQHHGHGTSEQPNEPGLVTYYTSKVLA